MTIHAENNFINTPFKQRNNFMKGPQQVKPPCN